MTHAMPDLQRQGDAHASELAQKGFVEPADFRFQGTVQELKSATMKEVPVNARGFEIQLSSGSKS
jgi:hypothetical protein